MTHIANSTRVLLQNTITSWFGHALATTAKHSHIDATRNLIQLAKHVSENCHLPLSNQTFVPCHKQLTKLGNLHTNCNHSSCSLAMLVSLHDRWGYQAIHHGAKKGCNHIVNLLLEAGASANACSPQSYVPLHLAAKGDHTQVCRTLLDAGADIDRTTAASYTALHMAAGAGCYNVSHLLLSRGANPYWKNDYGFQPWQEAERNGHLELAEVLKNLKSFAKK